MNTDRRRFLRGSGALTAAGLMGSLGTWGIESARAAGGDFKALVGVFLFGGNDSNNMVIPTDAARWNDYATVRSAASGIGHVQSMLQPVTDSATGNPYGLHPNLPDLKTVYDQGRMAIVANAGTLLAPIPDITTYKSGAGRPPNLFSHSDQQVAWMGQMPNVVARTGWGGRAADRLASINASALIPSTVSVSGNQIFAVGNDAVPFVIPGNGGVSLSGQGATGVPLARYNALRSLLGAGSGNKVQDEAAGILADALTANEVANPILTASLPPAIASAFNGIPNSGLAQQLKQVARLIDARGALSLTRQFFFVSIGGFDTHSNLLTTQVNLMTQLNDALSAFYDYTVAAGVASNVTTFTMSDFNRTFIGNANVGTDHAYGGHHFVLGGAVKGGRVYGTFPTLAVKGPSDVSSNGAWLPTTSVDQVGATLASWFGVSSADLGYVFPNLANFTTKNLGFV
ncbi:MAG TPA: DUF1501 domain-containing protein [Casimicrobiaceae bacterium]|nr:DUF1501 domain-containing protein [Casimicrobiaceae bacterium]